MRCYMAWIVIFLSPGLPSLAGAAFTPFVVENSGGSQIGPSVSGNVVVWLESMNGSFGIRGKNVVTGDTFTIEVPNATVLDPTTNGSIVVWADNRSGNSDVFAMDIQTGQHRTLVDEPHTQFSPDVGQDYVAWRDRRNTASNVSQIYAMDLHTGQEFLVGGSGTPDVSGNFIVWSRERLSVPPYGDEVYGYNIETGQQFLVASDASYKAQQSPAVSGDIIVWVDHRGVSGDIMGYEVSTGTTFPIHVDPAASPAAQSYPDIDGKYVIWLDSRNIGGVGVWSIVGYDLLTGQEFPIADVGGLVEPEISGSLVVWNTPFDPGTPSRIMGAYIPEPASVALLGLGAALLAGRRRGSTLTPARIPKGRPCPHPTPSHGERRATLTPSSERSF